MNSGGSTLRVGIIGAGRIARERHLPGFRALPDVRIVGVCNRRRESSARVAREFEIDRIYDTWEHLVEDDAIDAVVIATWPYLHCPITLAALDAGKHVLTQARMAMNAREAQRMLDRSRECPKQVAMVVPSPLGLQADAFVRHLIEDGYLGTLREVHVHGLSDQYADARAPLHWRQVTKYSGYNMLSLGILHETVSRWVAPATRVLARAAKLVPVRRDPEAGGKKVRVGTPDTVQVLTTHEDRSVGVYRLSGLAWHGGGTGVALYGSRGTLVYDLGSEEIRGARRGTASLEPLEVPAGMKGGWTVEEDFVRGIREGYPVTRTTFEEGVRYMQFTEAVARSSRHEEPVDLPLKEFSNPGL